MISYDYDIIARYHNSMISYPNGYDIIPPEVPDEDDGGGGGGGDGGGDGPAVTRRAEAVRPGTVAVHCVAGLVMTGTSR